MCTLSSRCKDNMNKTIRMKQTCRCEEGAGIDAIIFFLPFFKNEIAGLSSNFEKFRLKRNVHLYLKFEIT